MSAAPFRWDHLHLRSTDPDAAARFYVAFFGATLRDRAEDGERLRVTVDLAGLPLFIDRVPAGTPGAPEPPFRGLEHLGLAVDDIDGVVASLRARGADIETEPFEIRPGLRIAFIRGPENVRVELLQRS